MHLLTTLLSADPSNGYDYSYTTTTSTGGGSVPAGLILGLIAIYFLVVLVLLIIPLWKIFNKAGKPGWASIIPFYNSWVLFEIVGYPGWWAILGLVPIVNIFPAVMLLVSYFKLAKLFGKGDGFAISTVLFPFVCLPVLGYGKAQFLGGDDSGLSAGGGTPVAAQPYAPQSPAPTVSPVPPTTVQPTQPGMVQPTPQQPVQQPQQPAPPAPQQPTNPPQNPPIVQG